MHNIWKMNKEGKDQTGTRRSQNWPLSKGFQGPPEVVILGLDFIGKKIG